MQNLRGQPAAGHSIEGHRGSVLQVRQDHVHRPEEPARTAVFVRRIRGSQVGAGLAAAAKFEIGNPMINRSFQFVFVRQPTEMPTMRVSSKSEPNSHSSSPFGRLNRFFFRSTRQGRLRLRRLQASGGVSTRQRARSGRRVHLRQFLQSVDRFFAPLHQAKLTGAKQTDPTKISRFSSTYPNRSTQLGTIARSAGQTVAVPGGCHRSAADRQLARFERSPQRGRRRLLR